MKRTTMAASFIRALSVLCALSVPGAAQIRNLNESDLSAEWGAMKDAAAKMAVPAAVAAACGSSCDVDSRVYRRVLGYRCPAARLYCEAEGECSSYGIIGDQYALDIARQAAAGKIDVDAFLAAYARSCDFASAVDVGAGEESHALSSRVYQRVLGYRCPAARLYCEAGVEGECSSYGIIGDSGAVDIARRTAAGTIDVDVFLDAYKRSCSWNSALQVSRRRR